MLAAFCPPLQAQEHEQQPPDLAPVIGALNSHPGAQELLPRCPADVFKTQLPWMQRVTGLSGGYLKGSCAKSVQACAAACLEDKHGRACLSLGRLLEPRGRDARDMARRAAYGLACAYGQASGCTNRGASLRNAPRERDPLALNGEPREACLMRSFETACTAGDAWGCAMAGQAHRLGEGGPPDALKARARLSRTCVISGAEAGKETRSAPCRFARRQLERMNTGSEASQ